MLPFKLVYSEKYFLPIGEHIFRADKFRLIRERLLEQGVAEESDFVVPQPASEADVMLVHSPLYVNKLMEGGLSAREELQMEIPYSPQVVDAFMLHTGGSILAAERALEDGVCVNVGGGFHHAFPGARRRLLHDQRFCGCHSRHAEARQDSSCHDGGLRRTSGERHGFYLWKCAVQPEHLTLVAGGDHGNSAAARS